MFRYEEILDALPLDQIADQLEEPRSEVDNAVRNVLPALLMGLGANAQDPSGQASIAKALQQHDPAVVRDGVDLDQIDPRDGEKISRHIFGQNEGAVVSRLGGLSGGDGLVKKLIPLLAPVVMSWLAGKMKQDGGTSSAGVGGGLGDLLGKVLGGGGQTQAAPPPSQPRGSAQFKKGASKPAGKSAGPSIPFPDDDVNPLPQTQQTNQPSGGGLGGGVLNQILGDLLGGGRR